MTTFLWQYLETHSLEYFHVQSESTAHHLRGNIVLLLEGIPTHVEYLVDCDSQWRTYQAYVVQNHGGKTRVIHLRRDEQQRWHLEGQPIQKSHLPDIDLEITPATNTLAINRLNLAIGASAEVEAVWVRFPSLVPEILSQRYTRLEKNLYRYESLSFDFQTLIEVDDQGWVTHYHGLFKRIS